MSVGRVQVLLDTGPTSAEVRHIERVFASVGLAATAEGHSYGGPPPTSAFQIVISTAVAAFLDRFAAWPDGADRLRALTRELLDLRSDVRRWGRPHPVKVEDATTGLAVLLPANLPAAAYPALLAVDTAGIDRSSAEVRLAWSTGHARWTAGMTTAPVPVSRRLPARGGQPWTARVGHVGEADMAALWRLVDSDATGVVQWQRAAVVLWSALGWGVESIARRALLGPPRVEAIIRNFDRDRFASLDPGHADGETLVPSAAEQADAERVARRAPEEFGVSGGTWTLASLGEALVAGGVVEDLDPKWLGNLLPPRS